MEDRYLFRAWNKAHKKMFKVYQIDFKHSLLYCELEEGTTHTFGMCFCELMQYTERKDKNGKLIFGGDLIEDYHGDNYLVDFRYGAWCLIHSPVCGEEREGKCKWDYLHGFINLEVECEIIGNIHEDKK
jgi:uncharacterized phage protein (TIGR01671 family)